MPNLLPAKYNDILMEQITKLQKASDHALETLDLEQIRLNALVILEITKALHCQQKEDNSMDNKDIMVVDEYTPFRVHP